DLQAGDVQAVRLLRIQNALGDVDVEQAVVVGQLPLNHGAAADRQAVSPGAERDVAVHRAVADIQHVRPRAEADIAHDHRLIGVRHAVAVSVREFVVRYDDAVLNEGHAGRIGADVHGHGGAGLFDILLGRDDGDDAAGVVDGGKRAGFVADRHGGTLGTVDRHGDVARVRDRADVGAVLDQHTAGRVGVGAGDRALDRAAVEDCGQRSAAADQDGAAVRRYRGRDDSAFVAEAAGDRHVLARAPDLNRLGVHVLVNAGSFDRAAVDQAIGGIARAGRAQGDGVVGRAHKDGRSAAEGADSCGRFLRVRDAVAVAIIVFAVLLAVAVVVLVAVLDAVAVVVAVDAAGAVGGGGVEDDALADIAGDSHGRAALKQVIRVQVFQIGLAGPGLARRGLGWGGRSVAIARRRHRALNLDLTADVAVDGHAGRVLAHHADPAQQGDVAADIASRAHAVAVVADDVD